MNKKVLLNLAVIAITGSFGGLLAGYEMGIISGAQLFIVKEWNAGKLRAAELFITQHKLNFLITQLMFGVLI